MSASNIVQITDNLKFYCETDMEKYRMESFWTKEPETIEWIKSFTDCIFFDVGANIGVYSLYCASFHPDCLVYAFEPVRCNFIRLMQNIELNGFDNVIALPFAVGERSRIGVMVESEKEIGHSGDQLEIGEGVTKIVPIVSLDDLRRWETPDYLKVDIDGLELNVVLGALHQLVNIESCLIETNEYKEDIVSYLTGFGFTMDNQFNKQKNHSRIRRAKEGIEAENIIFTRK